MIFLTAGVVLHDRKGRVNLTPAFCVYGVFSVGMTAAGYPKITVTTVTAVTRRAEPPFFIRSRKA